MYRPRPFALLAFLLIATLVIGPNAQAEQIKVGGTGAAIGLMKVFSSAYEARYPGTKIEILPSLGSGGGITAVGAGALTIAVSGRPLKPEERAAGLREHLWARTPFVFVTSHPQADTLRSQDILATYDGKRTAWSDGSRIRLVLRPRSDSSTPALEKRFPGIGLALEALRKRKEIPVAATDQDNVELAERVPGSLTVATLSQIKAERPRISVIALDGVVPSTEALRRGTYTFAADIFLIHRGDVSADGKAFFDFLTSADGPEILEGYGAIANAPAH